MRVYVVRHPLTEFNVQNTVQGWVDSPLTGEGEKRCHEIAALLKNRKVSKIYSSDLGRCRQATAIINAYLEVPVEYVEALREQHWGVFEGKQKDEKTKWYAEHPDQVIPEGESLYDVQRRALEFMNTLKEDNCLLVTHGGTVAAILSSVYGLSPADDKCHPQHPLLITFEKGETISVVNIE